MMTENILNNYYTKLLESPTPGTVLNSLYLDGFGLPYSTKSIPFFVKLVRLYGRKIVFMALVDMLSMQSVDPSNFESLLVFFCKKRFEESHSFTELRNLKDIVDEVSKYKSIKNFNVKDPFNE